MNTPNGIIIAGMNSSSGKTAISCMILAALAERGIAVQPFKAGPDFIDPGYHDRFCSGAISRNLDCWLMGRENVLKEVAENVAGRIGVVEGVMGLFDGGDSTSDEGSTMELARMLQWPIILVVPCHKSGRSVAASLQGFIHEAGPGRIMGVILNQTNGESHSDYLKQAITPLGLPILGVLPNCEELNWPERHLGLQASQERQLPSRQQLAQLAEKYLNLSRLLAIVEPVPPLKVMPIRAKSRLRIGIARDEAFHFYYESNLDYLRKAGAELIPFSPIHDARLPANLNGLYFGGGFPEMFAGPLSDNGSLRLEIPSRINSGMPCYAECGGLMYLAEELVTLDGERFPMCGLIPGAVEMTERLNNFGYCVTSGSSSSPEAAFHGHEFHHSIWRDENEHANLWKVRRNRLGSERREGFRHKGLHASYVHLHFARSSKVVDKVFDLSPITKTVNRG